MDEVRIIEIKHSVFKSNEDEANKLRDFLKAKKVFLMNLMSSPGSGKTTTLLKTLAKLKDKLKIAVMEADIDSDVDAKKIKSVDVESIQLHTGGMCHLDALMTKQGLDNLDLDNLDLVIIENVGNLVCPAEFDTGAFKNVMILSIPEGDDKPLKYPLMFQVCDLVLINKIDVINYFDFNLNKVCENIKKRNQNCEIIFISAKNDENIDKFANWILNQVNLFKEDN